MGPTPCARPEPMATIKPRHITPMAQIARILRRLSQWRPDVTKLWRGWTGRIIGLLLVIGLAVLAWFWPSVHGNAVAGASVGARVACACHFIEGRPLNQCRDDFESGMGMVTISSDETAKSVTARVLVLSRQTATLKPGAGCVLEPWAN